MLVLRPAAGWWALGVVDGDHRRHFSRALIIIGAKRRLIRRDDAVPKLARLRSPSCTIFARLRSRGSAIYWLRFNLDFRDPTTRTWSWMLAWIVPLQGALFLVFGLYRGLWRFASMPDLQRIVLAAGLGALLIPLVLVMLRLQAVVPRSVLVFYPIVLIFLMAGDRFAYRIWKEHRLYRPLLALGEPVLVVGAGEAGARLTYDLARSRQWRVVGLLDDDQAKQGAFCATSACWVPIASLPQWAQQVRRAQGDHRAPFGRARRAPPGRGNLRRQSPRGAHRAVVRGSDQRAARAHDDPHDRARRPSGTRPGGARQRGSRGLARQSRRARHRRRRFDRRRALPPDRALPAGEARPVRHFRGGALRDQDVADRRVSAAAGRGGRRRREARRAGR